MNNQLPQDQHWKVLVLILKKIAEDKDMTIQEVADTAGLKRQNVSRMFLLNVEPQLSTFLAVARAIGVNFFIEDQEGKSELNVLFEAAMTELGRRPDNLPKN